MRSKRYNKEWEKEVRKERREFEEWFISKWECDFIIYFNSRENYGYRQNFVETAWQTWKHLKG